MKITTEYLELLFTNTTQHQNGYTLSDCLKGRRGELENTIYSLIDVMKYNGNERLDVFLLHADGGVKDFLILYNLGEFKIIASRIKMFDIQIFTSVQVFCDYLNKIQRKIMLTIEMEKTDLTPSGG